MSAPFPVIDELVPHAGSMILVDALTAWAPGEATARLTIRDRAPFVKDGRVETVVSIEYMAQTVAACLGYEALRGGSGVRVGMIIACKRFVAHVPSFAVDDALTITVKCIRGNDTLSHFDCRVERTGELASAAVLTLYHAEKPPADLG
jgi:predicted hotdog family 3-hydroxylacyl-ACP dehydratase